MIIKFTANHKIYIQNSTPRTRIEGRRRTWNDGRRKTLPPMKSLSTLASISCLMGGFVALFFFTSGGCSRCWATASRCTWAGDRRRNSTRWPDCRRRAPTRRRPSDWPSASKKPPHRRRPPPSRRLTERRPTAPLPVRLGPVFLFYSFLFIVSLHDGIDRFCREFGHLLLRNRKQENSGTRQKKNWMERVFRCCFFLVELKFSWGASQLGNTVPRAPMHSSFIGQKWRHCLF